MPFFHNLIVYASKSTNSNKFKISANYNNNSNNAFYAIICNTLPAGWAFPVIVPVSRLYRDGPYESHFDCTIRALQRSVLKGLITTSPYFLK